MEKAIEAFWKQLCLEGISPDGIAIRLPDDIYARFLAEVTSRCRFENNIPELDRGCIVYNFPNGSIKCIR